jgi:hypothetical protein
MTPSIRLGLLLAGLLVAQGCTGARHPNDPDAAAADGGQDAAMSGAAAGGRGGGGRDNSLTRTGAAGNAGHGDDWDGGGVPTDDCSDIDVAQTTLTLSVSPRVPQITWSGIIRVTARLSIDDATVTIEPGTTFIMDADSGLTFGSYGKGTTLFARGTPEKPIRFCGRQRKPGYWQGVTIGSDATSDGVLDNVIVTDAGGQEAGVILSAPLTVNNLRVVDSSTDGIHASSFHAGSRGLGVEGARRQAVVLLSPDAATNFPFGGIFSNNAENTIRLRFSDIVANAVFGDATIPYVQEQKVDVHRGAELTFEAGVDYRFTADTSLDVGWNSDDATIYVQGTQDKPVVFRGAGPTKGYWHGISIEKNVRSTSRIAHARILHGGGEDSWPLDVSAPVTVDSVSLEDNEHGVYLRARLNDDSVKVSVTRTNDVPVRVVNIAMPTVPKGGDFTGNAHDTIDVVGSDEVVTILGTVREVGIPYRLLDSISLDKGSDLQVEPGTNFVVAADKFIEVGWNSESAKLVALGTAAKPIAFRGEQDTVGSWPGIVVRASASGDCKLEHVQLSNAGQATKAALTLERAIGVTSCSFSKSAGYGILKHASDTTAYEAANTFEMVAVGDVGTY